MLQIKEHELFTFVVGCSQVFSVWRPLRTLNGFRVRDKLDLACAQVQQRNASSRGISDEHKRLTIRRPIRLAIVSSLRQQWLGPSTVESNGVQTTGTFKSDLCAVRRPGGMK